MLLRSQRSTSVRIMALCDRSRVDRWPIALGAKDANEWWNTFEVNVRGVYNYLRCEQLRSVTKILLMSMVQSGHSRHPRGQGKHYRRDVHDGP